MFQGSINSFQVLGFSKNIRCHPLFFRFSLLLVLFAGGVLCFSGKAYSSESLQKLLYQETGTSEWENRGEDDTHWVYRGEQKNGLPHGQGIATHPLGATYSGGWKEGLYHGQGIFKSLNKATFQGQFHEGKKHGHIEFEDPSGNRFSGIFQNNRRHGQGIQFFPDGSSLKGIWEKGRLVEELEFRNPRLFLELKTRRWNKEGNPEKDGLYEGEIKDGKPEGRGSYKSPDGFSYEGIWKAGIREGMGILIWPDGTKYTGEFRDGKRHGRGKQVFPEGHVYVGDFEMGLRHGLGDFTYGSGSSKGDRYIGDYFKGRRHGQGTYLFADGRKYVGQFEKGRQSGEGRFYWKNGVTFEGEFRNGKPWQGRIIDKYCEILELKGFSCHDGIVENGVFKKNSESLKTIIQDSLSISDPLITDAIILLLKKRADRSDLIQAVCSVLSSDNAAVRAESAQIIGLTAKDSDYARKALIDTLQISMDDTPSVIQAMTRMGDSMIDQLLDYDDSNEAFEKKLTEVLTSLGDSRINKLLESLQSDRVVASTRAAGALAMMDRIPKEAVSELVNALDSPIENVQLSSLKALHRQEELSFEAIGKIRSFASGNRIEHRVAAIQLLAKVDASSEETLIIFDEAARESNLLLRLAVLEAITGKTFVRDRYVEFLQNCFLEKDKEIRLRAIGVLAQMELCPQQFEKTLFQLVKDDSVQVRFSALKALGVIETKSPMLSARIAAMLPGADTEMLVEILQVLASYQESASEQFGVVKKLLSHPSSEVRAQAAVCLAKINEDSDSVIDAVLPLLKDEDWLVRKTAAKSLAEYGPAAKRAVADLFRLLDSEEDEEAARDALKAIDDVGPEALEVLMNGLDSDDRRIRFYAMYLIGKIGPAAEVAIPKLEAMLQDSDSGRFRETIQQAIDRIQPLDESR